MANELFEGIKRGLEEALDHSKGESTNVKIFTPQQVGVKKIRENGPASEAFSTKKTTLQ